MNTSQYRFTLDLQSTQSQVCIPVTRGDTARTWLISFRDGSNTYKISDGCLAKLEILRPTGTHIEEFCPIENNLTVRYSFSQNKNTAAVEGFHECAVVLYDEEGHIIGSPRFSMIVSDRVVSVDTIPLSDENKLIIDSIIPEEISRRNAETERINAEAERTASEAQRTLNEAARQTADTERSLAEENRNKRFETLQKEINTAAATLVSPTVTVTPTENGNRITVTDKKGEHTFHVTNGAEGEQGPRGLQGPQGPQGIQGVQGKPFAIEKTFSSVSEMSAGFAMDGVSEGGFVIIASGVENEDNAKLFVKGKTAYTFVTDLSGAQGLQGPQGEQGPQGLQGLQGIPGKSAYQYAQEMGYTGTEEAYGDDINPDMIKAELNTYISEELAKRGQLKPEFAISVENMTDTSKLYVLCDPSNTNNGYIYAYMNKKVWANGCTNLVSGSTDSSGNPYNGGKGYKFGYRLNSSGVEVELSNCFVTGFMPVKNGDTLRIKNFAKGSSANMGYTGIYIALYNSSYTKLTSTAGSSLKTLGTFDDNKIFTVSISSILDNANIAFVRISTNIVDTAVEADGEKLIVTVNEEINDGEYVDELGWASTGHHIAPLSSIYETRLNVIEQMMIDHDEKLNAMQADEAALPSYWMEEMRTKADTIQQTMEAAGRNKSAFLWYTDAHWQFNSQKSPALLKYLIANTSMNKVNFGGDIVCDPSAHTHDNIRYVYDWRKMISDLPNHHSVFGNHDVNHRTTDVSKMAYAYMISPEETPDMVIGGDSFYYIDNPAEKTRYLYLSYITSNTEEQSSQRNFVIEALNGVKDGWHIVVIAHRWWQYTSASAPTVGKVPDYESTLLQVFDAYNARETIENSIVDFTNAKGKVEFCIGGHIHIDYDFATDGGVPIIITASDANQERVPNSEADCGISRTITESAVFGIIADYNSHKITIVGIGRGTSREIFY